MTSRRAAQGGSASVAALIVLMLLATLAAASGLLLGGLQDYQKRSADRSETRARLEGVAREIAALLAGDATPQADSLLDPVWASVGRAREDGLTVSLSDLSSLLNPNWIQKAFFTRTAIRDLLAPGAGPDLLQQRREDRGFSTEIASAYGDLFREGVLDEYFSGYGYANVNTTDEFSLRRLYQIRTKDSSGAERFHALIQEALAARRVIDRKGLEELLGAAYTSLYPLVNAEPGMNAHFVPAFLVRELLAYPDWGVPHPEDAFRVLVQRRQEVELTAEELRRIIGAPEASRVYQYLGTTTWFWRIRVSSGSGGERLEVVVARLPPQGEEPPRFVMVEERYVR